LRGNSYLTLGWISDKRQKRARSDDDHFGARGGSASDGKGPEKFGTGTRQRTKTVIVGP